MFYRLPNAIQWAQQRAESISHDEGKAGANYTELTRSFKILPLVAPCWWLRFLQVNFLRDHWFHSSPVLGETCFLAQPLWEVLVSLGFIRFSAFWPGIRLGCHSIRKGQSRQRQLRITSASSVTALDWHTVTSLRKSSLQTLLSFGPQSLG